MYRVSEPLFGGIVTDSEYGANPLAATATVAGPAGRSDNEKYPAELEIAACCVASEAVTVTAALAMGPLGPEMTPSSVPV